MNTPKLLPSFQHLHECFILMENGDLIWQSRPLHHFKSTSLWRTQNTRDAGRKAGSPDAKGYLRVRFDGQLHLCHRIVWKMVHNEEPPAEIDHIDQVRHNNTPSNLRAASRSLNCINKGVRSDNHSGIKGIGFKNGRWRARIYVSGRSVYLGSFSTAVAAAAAHMTASIQHYGADAIAPGRRADFEDLVIAMADADVRAGIRSIPGFEITQERKAV